MADAYEFGIDFVWQQWTMRRPYQPRIRRRGRANLRAMERDRVRRFEALNRKEGGP